VRRRLAERSPFREEGRFCTNEARILGHVRLREPPMALPKSPSLDSRIKELRNVVSGRAAGEKRPFQGRAIRPFHSSTDRCRKTEGGKQNRQPDRSRDLSG
jgi:hypothetical protein